MDYPTYLKHYGVLGMHWGVRKEDRVARATRKMAKKDAQKYANARMAYGEGSGIQRRHVKAELARKMKDPNYKKSFDDALEAVNYNKAIKTAKRQRVGKDVKNQTIRSTKQIAKFFTGTTTMAAGYILYRQNKPAVDAFVKNVLLKYGATIRR